MYGTITGNIIGTLYFLAFQVCGILIALRFIKSERLTFRILIGSVIGSVGLHWCPVLFSFLFDFTQTSHICGLVFFVFITVLALWLSTPVSNGGGREHKKDYNSSKNKNAAGDAVKIKDSILNYPFLIVGIPLFIFFCMLLWNHTIVEYPDGSIYTGQCTFGDMNMHLGFITSIAKQQTFPPYYSILPDTKLAYPFLSDAISSSVYIWGATLRYAYMLPMWFAILQVMFGMYTFAESWLKSRWKAFLAFVLFFFNGADANSFIEAGKVVSINDIRAEYPDYASNMNDDLIADSLVDGKKYAVPVNGFWEAMFVNTEILDAAGVAMPGADYTFDQFLADCQKIKDAGYTPIACALGNIPHYWWEYSIFNHTGVDKHLEVPASVDSEGGQAWVAGMEDIKTLYEAGCFPENTLSATDDEK